jgi:hypothetical protein
MTHFADRRKANHEAAKARITRHHGTSPLADYEGGKYEPMQYEPDVNYYHQIAKATRQEPIESL